ncbi:hypothetical protein GCM10022244_03190 [Streptomyces gulbargensis]|uniref:Ribosomal protein S27a domain-containing protein n=1 Tax=Streptomyces gulbargensis TaxID=364901 RepID=A0ABP7L9J4_9ACTN
MASPSSARGAVRPLPLPEITRTECRRCGALIKGLNHRYACTSCGWVNPSGEGSRPLPAVDPWPVDERPRTR